MSLGHFSFLLLKLLFLPLPLLNVVLCLLHKLLPFVFLHLSGYSSSLEPILLQIFLYAVKFAELLVELLQFLLALSFFLRNSLELSVDDWSLISLQIVSRDGSRWRDLDVAVLQLSLN